MTEFWTTRGKEFWLKMYLTYAFVDVDLLVQYDLGHFTCPMCGIEYVPFQQKHHMIEPNEILVCAPGNHAALARSMNIAFGEVSY